MTKFGASLASALTLVGSLAVGQTNERIYEQLDFRTVTPGARAVGMGKTFVGLADDATAAFSNPAGLSNLFQQEFSLEFQMTEYMHERLVASVPGGDLETQVFGDTVVIPTFFSYVLPLRRSTLSFFANRVQDYREEFEFSARRLPVIEGGAFGRISIQADNYGLGYSFVVNRYLSVGGSFVVSNIHVDTKGRSGTMLNPRNGTDTRDSATTVTGIGGVLVKPSRTLSFGAVYYAGSNYELETTLFGNFLEATSATGRDVDLTGEIRPIEYVVPGRFAFGGSWRATDSFTLVADVAHVRYSSQVTDQFLVVDFLDSAAGLTRDNFSIRDVWEVHAGAEFRVYGRNATFAFRGGVFTDPDHQLRFNKGGPQHIAQAILDNRFNRLDPVTDVGFSFGAGVAIKNVFQTDFAASFSPDASELVLSFVIKPW